MKDNYEEIINLPHYEPKHKRMSRENRAAQFAPFAALTGFEEKISEAARLTDKKIELDDGLKEILNKKLIKLNEIIKEYPEIEITYFVPDVKKEGGKYLSENVKLKRIDFISRFLKLTDNRKIMIDDIINIKSKYLSEAE